MSLVRQIQQLSRLITKLPRVFGELLGLYPFTVVVSVSVDYFSSLVVPDEIAVKFVIIKIYPITQITIRIIKFCRPV